MTNVGSARWRERWMNSASATDAPRQAREIVDKAREARPRQEKEKEKGDVMKGWKEGKTGGKEDKGQS